MRVLVTGGSGFIGTNYIQYLNNKQIEILNIDIKPPMNKNHREYYTNCDIMDYEKLCKIIKEFLPTHVVHLAATTGAHSIKDIRQFAPNIKGVENLISALQNSKNIERVIFASSLLVCKIGYIPKNDTDYLPNTAYGLSKVEGEKLIRRQGGLPFCWTIIRPISVWGPFMEEPYYNFFKAIQQGWYFHIGDGHFKRSMGYVENIAHQIHCILTASKSEVNRKTFYLGDPEPTDLYYFAENIRENLSAPRIRSLPVTFIKGAAKVGDVLKLLGWKNVPLSSFRLNNICTEYVFDLSPIMAICGQLPYDMDAAIGKTVRWFIEN